MRESNDRQEAPEKSEKEQLEVELLLSAHHHKGRMERLWKPKELRLTESYSYITHNPLWRVLHYLFTWIVLPPLYLFFWIRWKFRVHGRRNLKAVHKRAAISVSNHIHDLDGVMTTSAYWPRTPYIVARKHNLEVFLLGMFNRSMRAVPLPDDMENFVHFSKAIDELLRTSHHKLHIFPEGEIDAYARELRRFGNGAFHFAINSEVPVIPMVFVSPKRGHIELIIGEVIEPMDLPGMRSLTKPKQVRVLAQYTKQVMEDMLKEYYDTLPDSK